MHANKEVAALRKSGRLEEALQVGTAALTISPDDRWLKQAMAWVYYDYAKRTVAEIEKTIKVAPTPPGHLLAELRNHLRSYAKLRLDRPDMSLSQILRVLTSVGKHCDFFLGFLSWSGIDGFSAEDLEPYRTENGAAPALITKVAREAVARCLKQPDELVKWGPFLSELVDKAILNEKEVDSNRIWIIYDRAALYKHLGRTADAEAEMRRVLKQKRDDSWAWAKMAELYVENQPNLAIACYAQAMLCGLEPKFAGKQHIRFGGLLQQRGETAAAISEYLAAADVYRSEDRRFPDELEAVLRASWFNPEHANPDQKQFYQARAGEALDLLYDEVRQVNATYLAKRENAAGKPRHLVSITTSEGPEQMLIRWRGEKSSGLRPGKALTLTLGYNEKGAHVLACAPRAEGELWDCLQTGQGVITHMKEDGSRGGVFLGRDSHVILIEPSAGNGRSLQTGDAVQIWVSCNPKQNYRLEAFQVQRLHSLPEHPDIAVHEGELRVHEKGFAFIGDVFVPPQLVDPDMSQQMVSALCVFELNKKKGSYGWKALMISAAGIGVAGAIDEDLMAEA